MRRSDREVLDPAVIRRILDDSKVLHLGLQDDGAPYVVPLNYGYELEEGRLTLYVHGAGEGHKLDLIRRNAACFVEMECHLQPIEAEVACRHSISFYSLMGRGHAEIVEDPAEKMSGLACLMKTQTGRDYAFNEQMVSAVTVIRVRVDAYTAKHRPMPGAQ